MNQKFVNGTFSDEVTINFGRYLYEAFCDFLFFQFYCSAAQLCQVKKQHRQKPIPTTSPTMETELGIEDIQKELEELEKLLSELQELENVTFEI